MKKNKTNKKKVNRRFYISLQDKIKSSKYYTKRNIIILSAVVILIIISLVFTFINRGLDTITLETHANEVSEWKYEIDNKSIIKFYNKKRSGDIEGKTSEGLITERYTFKALKPGKTTLKFTFKNTVNNSYGEVKYYNISVDKNLKLTIKEKKDN